VESLSQSLFNLSSLPATVSLQQSEIPVFAIRLLNEATHIDPTDVVHAATFLHFLGTTALIGVSLPPQKWLWLGDRLVADVVGWHNSHSGSHQIDQLQIQLWLGLYEAARLVDHVLAVPPDAGSKTLELWQNAQPPDVFETALKSHMVTWLEQCAASGWKLLPQHRSLYQLLH
jgi:hypothetical protein